MTCCRPQVRKNALILLQTHPCDLVLSDIQMPEIDGFQFCRLCQLDETLRHIPFVFYTATQDVKHTRHQARKVGARAVVIKPADPARLLKTIGMVLAREESRIKTRQQEARGSGDFSTQIPAPVRQDRHVDRVLENVPGIVWTLDAGGEFSYVSPGVDRLTGFSAGRVQNMGHSGWVNRIHASDKKNVHTSFNRMFTENEPLDIVYRFKCRDGRFVWFQEKSGSLYENGSDGCCRVDGVTMDITARMMAQDQRMSEKEQAGIATFSKGISHDLDNLLNGITDYLQLSALRSATSRDRERFLDNALKISRRALALNRDISLLSTMDRPVEKNALFSRVVAGVVRSVLDGRGIAYRVDISDAVWPCRVNTRLMARALEHVIVNACDAVGQKRSGFIAVTLENLHIDENSPAETPEICGIHSVPGQYVQAVIQDNGRGIDAPALCQVFYPYFSSKPRDMKQGVGLSLAVARVIVLRHGGDIGVCSGTDHGTQIIIRLPAQT
ncbi:MAG: response regulator [Desulfotignum sp.]|nr:response regulator [Desulfotignum sp.]